MSCIHSSRHLRHSEWYNENKYGNKSSRCHKKILPLELVFKVMDWNEKLFFQFFFEWFFSFYFENGNQISKYLVWNEKQIFSDFNFELTLIYFSILAFIVKLKTQINRYLF